MTVTADAASAERRLAFGLLAVLCAGFALFAWFYVRRLNNYAMGDAEFTGWTAPFARRLAVGERPYLDFVLPLPPGSLAVLAAIQATAQVRLLHELGLIAVCQLALALLGYAIAAPLTTRLNAVLAAAGTLVLVIQIPNETAYDHCAQLCVWSSLALGVRASLCEPGRTRVLLLRATGLVAGACFAFKQNTGAGVVGGWVLAFFYLALCAWPRGAAGRAEVARDAKQWALGAGLGIALTLGLVLALGSSLGAFWQVVVVDATRLKGGASALLAKLGSFLFLSSAFPSGILATLVAIGIGARFMHFERRLHLGQAPPRGELRQRPALAVAALLAGAFLVALAPLLLELRELPQLVLGTALVSREVPQLGLALACAFFVGHHAGDAPPEATRRRGHVLNALLLVALSSSLLHELSFVEFHPFYTGDPLIPLALACLFAALDRGRLPWLKALALLALFASLFGVKYARALTADTRVETGYWSGLRVNYRGRELLDAARRVKELTRPDERVLMLPEDAAIVPLFERPRPPLRGAVVFVDQYPARLAASDIAVLERDPPKVIVIHPQRRAEWRRLFWNFGGGSGAERLILHVLDHQLPARYRLDSTYRTIYFWDQGQLEIWVRKDG